MIEEGDKVMVCLSGGKDSYALLDVLLALQRKAPVDFELVAVNLDQKQPGFPAHVLPEYLEVARRAVPHRRAGHLLGGEARRSRKARRCARCARACAAACCTASAGELGATKIALGHHRDDILATFFLNLFYGGKLKAMPPKLRSRRRPARRDPAARLRAPRTTSSAYAEQKAFPIIPCNLCGSQENLQRKVDRRDAARVGDAASPGASSRSCARWPKCGPRTCSTGSCSTFRMLPERSRLMPRGRRSGGRVTDGNSQCLGDRERVVQSAT